MLSKKQHVDDTRVIFHARDFLSDFCAARAPLGWRARIFFAARPVFSIFGPRAPHLGWRAHFFFAARPVFSIFGVRAPRAPKFFLYDSKQKGDSNYIMISLELWFDFFRKTDLFAVAIIQVVVPSLTIFSLFLRILESFFSSFLLCLWQRPSLPRKKKSIVVRGFKTFPKVKTFFSFSTPNRLFFLFKHGLFQKYKSNGELIACIILTKFEKMKIFSVSQTKIYFLFFKNHTVGPNHKSNDEKLTHFDFDTKTSKNSFFFKTST